MVRFRGHVSLTDIVSGVRQLWADPLYQTEYDGLVDLADTTTRATVADLRSLLTFLTHAKVSRGRWVGIFNEPKPTALAMLFKAANPLPLSFEVVSTWEAACAHLRQEIPTDLRRN